MIQEGTPNICDKENQPIINMYLTRPTKYSVNNYSTI